MDKYLLTTISLAVAVVTLVLGNQYYPGIFVTNVAQNATQTLTNQTVNQTDFLTQMQAFNTAKFNAQADHIDRKLDNIGGNISILIQLLNKSSR